jgi:riboflavin biosynthesis pyrimidine reductase
MGRLVNTTAMTVDGVVEVSDWFVSGGEHNDASLALFDDRAALLLGRKTCRLKGEHDGDLVLSGCGELARELIQAGLADELLFWIHPRIQGSGTRPYEAATLPVRLIEAKPFSSGVTLLRYEPVGRDR